LCRECRSHRARDHRPPGQGRKATGSAELAQFLRLLIGTRRAGPLFASRQAGSVPAPRVLTRQRVGQIVFLRADGEPHLRRRRRAGGLPHRDHHGASLKPRDKAKVEVGVQVVQRWILARADVAPVWPQAAGHSRNQYRSPRCIEPRPAGLPPPSPRRDGPSPHAIARKHVHGLSSSAQDGRAHADTPRRPAQPRTSHPTTRRTYGVRSANCWRLRESRLAFDHPGPESLTRCHHNASASSTQGGSRRRIA
jgi:hypothetical protein